MNRMENGGEAKLRYGTPDFQVVRPGAYVRCAVTGDAIPLACRRNNFARSGARMARLVHSARGRKWEERQKVTAVKSH